ncbi:MAG TPA: serine hydrolase [Gaiellales bacterium]|nr:serine hydrolase [Gaiellales bacterium]
MKQRARESVAACARRVVECGQSPGLVVGLTDRRRTLAVIAEGVADTSSGRALDSGAVLQIGSISKSFAALCLMQEMEAGRVALDDPVTRYLPWFAFGDADAITLEHLLLHTAGLPCGSEPAPPSVAQIALLAGERPVWAPGDRHWYSNSGYATLGLVLESLTGMTAAETVRRRVLDPLGMQHTVAVIGYGDRLRMPAGHEPLRPDRHWRPGDPVAPAPWTVSESADGSICADAEDMLRYARLLLGGGAGIVRPESFRRMTETLVPDGEGGEYGYALERRMVDGRPAIGHSGGMVGFHADLVVDPEAGVGVIAMVNGPAGAVDAARHALLVLRADAEGAPVPDPPELPGSQDEGPILDAQPAAELLPYAGRFRCHSPWSPELAIGVRGGRLWASGGYGEHPMEQESEQEWRLRDGRGPLPELLRFDLPVDGRFQRITWTGAVFGRAMEG